MASPRRSFGSKSPEILLPNSQLSKADHRSLQMYLTMGEEKSPTVLVGETFIPSSLGLHRSQFIYPAPWQTVIFDPTFMVLYLPFANTSP